MDVTFTPNTKYENAGTLLFINETHTVGNLLRHYLLQDQDVQFAGYKNPHPLQPEMYLKVVGTEQPVNLTVMKACERIIDDITSLETQFIEQKNSVNKK